MQRPGLVFAYFFPPYSYIRRHHSNDQIIRKDVIVTLPVGIFIQPMISISSLGLNSYIIISVESRLNRLYPTSVFNMCCTQNYHL